MKYQLWMVLVGCTCAVLFWQGASGRARVTRSAYESLRIYDNYIINFKENVTEKQLNRFVAKLVKKSDRSKLFNAEILQKFFSIKCVTARLSKRALAWVNRRKIVLEVKENEYIKLGSGSKSSPHVHGGWHLDRLDQPSLPLDNKPYTMNYSGSNVDVYVLDSGINYEHIAFNGRAHYPGCDPVDKAENEKLMGRDCRGHGTHVAGLIGGKGIGVASDVTLFSVRILNCNLTATEETLIEGLMCVIEHRKSRNGTRAIINLAIAGKHTTLGINKALQLAINNNIIIVSSSGNGRYKFRSVNYDSCEVYPAGYPGVVNVGATDIEDNALMGEFDNNTLFTNMGNCLDVFAPGYSILSSYVCPPELSSSCYNRLCTSFKSGTSQSSAIVAGAVALLLEKCPKITYTEVKNMLRHTLSVRKVKFYEKALTFLSKDPLLLLDVIKTIADTRNSLLHLDLARVNCSEYSALPLY